MPSLNSTAVAVAPAVPAFADPVLAGTSLVSTVLASAALADSVLVGAALARTAKHSTVPFTTVPFTTVPFTAAPFTAAPYTAAPSRARSGAGTWPCGGVLPVLHDHATAQLTVAVSSLMAAGQSLIARFQASDKTAAFGAGAHAANKAGSACQQRTQEMYTHPITLIAPTGGGGLGPYPARDPV